MLNKETHNQIVTSLPAMSRSVYLWLNDVGLYAEEGFTDVTVDDIASKLKMEVDSVKGCVGNLVKVGLCSTYASEVSVMGQGGRVKSVYYDLVTTALHDEEVEGLTKMEWLDALGAAVEETVQAAVVIEEKYTNAELMESLAKAVELLCERDTEIAELKKVVEEQDATIRVLRLEVAQLNSKLLTIRNITTVE